MHVLYVDAIVVNLTIGLALYLRCFFFCKINYTKTTKKLKKKNKKLANDNVNWPAWNWSNNVSKSMRFPTAIKFCYAAS